MNFQDLDPTVSAALVQSASSLSQLALKNIVTLIQSRTDGIKTETDATIIRNTYDEIINMLIEERAEAVTIAQLYKHELEKVVISDDDIQHLHNTITRLLDILKRISPENTRNIESYAILNDLVSADTLKTMQLIGFNYKAAIGEPLTELCTNAISNLGKRKSANNVKNNNNKANKK